MLKHFKALSKELQICLPISFFEVHNNNYFNTTVVYDSGVDLGYYRKSHIPTGPGYEEKFQLLTLPKWATQGDEE